MTTRKTLPQPRSLPPGVRLEQCRLRVVSGPDQGLSVALEAGRLTVGARASCDLQLSDPKVSGVHAEVALVPDGVRVRDLDSTNGVRYLERPVQSVVLLPGSLFSLGDSVLAVLPPGELALEASDEPRYGELIGHSVALRRVFALLRRLEQSDAPVLLEGETGTGKSLAAEALHRHGARRDGPFVCFDCGAIAPSLLASELFGHVRGAFSGADSDRAGAVDHADGGTLFLDEVGELPLELQPLLLRFVEQSEVRPVGNVHPHRVDVRVIAATNQPLEHAVEAGRFRRDLFYRLGVVRIEMPPLRRCPEDIVPLARHFLALSGAEHSLSAEALATLRSYRWPGNIRQLRNAVTRLVHLGQLLDGEWDDAPAQTPADFHSAKRSLIDDFERHYLEELLRQQRGNLSAAARQSGLARHHLRRLLNKHGIEVERFRGG